MALAWLGGWFSAELLLMLVVVLAVNANEAHKWAHRTRAENGRLISFLQDWKLVQGHAHHGRHQGGTRNSTFCALIACVDPLLDRLGMWRGLERLVLACTGVPPPPRPGGRGAPRALTPSLQRAR